MFERPMRIRYFTLTEANTALRELRPIIDRLTEHTAQIRELLLFLREPDNVNEQSRHEAQVEVESLRKEVKDIVETLAEQGIEVKGLSPLLLDFPGLRNGQEALLCWKEGESVLAWWHHLNTGFAGRQPLAAEDGGAWEWCN